jgi:hypothetical protein
MVILGFDPGGVKHFGWCVAQAKNAAQLQFRSSGIANHAAGAVEAALAKADEFGRLEQLGLTVHSSGSRTVTGRLTRPSEMR